MKTTQALLAAVVLGNVMFTPSANAALISRLGGQAVYDTDRNITWLANANLAATNTFGLARNVDLGTIAGINTYGGSYIYTSGGMTWGGALKWLAAMNAANYLGYNDWRLPTTLQPDSSCTSQWSGGVYGTQSGGYNCRGSELGHLFYSELGGVAGSPLFLPPSSLFNNIWASGNYWSGQYAPSAIDAWSFYFGNGLQGTTHKYYNFFTLAVRSGDVAAVPVPAAAWLLSSGLLGLICVGRRLAI